MADKKISALTGAATPLDGTEVLPIVQSGATVKVANNDLRPKQIQSNATSGVLQVAGPAAAATRVMTTPDANFTAARTDAGQTFTGNQTLTGDVTVGTTGGTGFRVFAVTKGTIEVDTVISVGGGNGYTGTSTNHPFSLMSNNVIGITLDTSQNMQLGPTASVVSGRLAASVTGTGVVLETNGASGYYPGWFQVDGAQKGYITTSTLGTTYNTVSDYRLKENIAPMTGALDKVMALKPCTYTWKEDGSNGQGFIAHELAEIVPECVTGEIDGVHEQLYEVSPAVKDEDGNIVAPAVISTQTVPFYQGIDTSNLVATLTAAIQELKADFEAYKASHP